MRGTRYFEPIEPVSRGRTTDQEGHERAPIAIIYHHLVQKDGLQRRENSPISTEI